MPLVTEITYSVDALQDANDAFLALIDAGTGAGKVNYYDDADTLLATITFDDPAGTTSGVDGSLTLSPSGLDTSPAATGAAAYVEILDSDDNVIVSIPVIQGSAPVVGYCVMPNINITTSGEVELNSAVAN